MQEEKRGASGVTWLTGLACGELAHGWQRRAEQIASRESAAIGSAPISAAMAGKSVGLYHATTALTAVDGPTTPMWPSRSVPLRPSKAAR